MRMKSTILGVLSLLLLAGCMSPYGWPSASEPAVTESVAPSPTPSMSEPEPEPTPELQPLALPTAEMFGLEGLNAALFDAAMEYESRYITPGLDDLCIPRIGIFAMYESGEDELGVICWVETYGYSGYYLTGGRVDFGIESRPARVIVKLTDNEQYEWTDYSVAASGQSDLPGQGWAGSIIEMCEPVEGLAEKILSRTIEPEYEMSTQRELLEMYRNATGTSISVTNWNGLGE